jgi:elongation factor 1-beta
MQFGDLNAATGLQALDGHLADKSYIGGYLPTQADLTVLKAVGAAPGGDYINALRWFKHISSFVGAETAAFPKADFEVVVGGGAAAKPAAAAAPAKEEEEDDDDFDMFASDDEVDEEAEKIKAERLAAYAEKKSKKPALIAKSNIILDVKPWDDETDLGEMEKCIRTIEKEGLLWGKAEKKPIAYGIFKLTISAVVEDDKVSVDWMEEKITEFEDYVQSVDIAAFQKI